MSTVFSNWKTTAAGVGLVLVAVGHVLSGVSAPGGVDVSQITTDIMALLGGFGLVAAKDYNSTGGTPSQ